MVPSRACVASGATGGQHGGGERRDAPVLIVNTGAPWWRGGSDRAVLRRDEAANPGVPGTDLGRQGSQPSERPVHPVALDLGQVGVLAQELQHAERHAQGVGNVVPDLIDGPGQFPDDAIPVMAPSTSTRAETVISLRPLVMPAVVLSIAATSDPEIRADGTGVRTRDSSRTSRPARRTGLTRIA